MTNEDNRHGPQSSLWSSSETAEHWQQDVERRRRDMAEATRHMLETAGLKSGDHVLDVGAGTGDQGREAEQSRQSKRRLTRSAARSSTMSGLVSRS